MVNKVIQAVAGAGKTYKITHEGLDTDKSYLFLTYTNGNVNNLLTGLIDAQFSIDNFEVLTFSKFIIDWMLKPFLPIMEPNLTSKFKGNFTLQEPISNSQHFGYIKQEKVGHYIDSHDNFYVNRISTYVKNQQINYWNKVWNRLGKYVDVIFIDEFQDLTGNDFEILKKMMKQTKVQVIAVGDVYQSNVSKSDKRKSSKLKLEKNTILPELQKHFGKRVQVDLESMLNSRRISSEVASFVKEKLQINIKSDGKHLGSVHLLNSESEIQSALLCTSVVLTWSNAMKVPGNLTSMSWSYSKGDTYDGVLVVLTDKLKNIMSDDFTIQSLEVRNKLYVAMTRSTSDLYLVTSQVWKKFVASKNNA